MRKWIVILLFLPLLGFSQVPDTETFKLDTVVDIVNPTTDDLQDCFNDANANYFHPTHYGNYMGVGGKNTLLQFRDYKVRETPLYPYSVILMDSYSTSTSLTCPFSEAILYPSSVSEIQDILVHHYCSGSGPGYDLYSKINCGHLVYSNTPTLSVGSVVALIDTGDFLPTGYYTDQSYSPCKILYVINGIVQSVDDAGITPPCYY